MPILREGLNLATAITAAETSSLQLLPSCPDVVPSHEGPLVGRLASQIRVLGLGLGLDPRSSSSSTNALCSPTMKPPSWPDLAPEAAFLAWCLDGWRGGGKKACSWMCSGVRRGGEANNAIRELASVSQTHTRTHTDTAVFVFIYQCSSHINDNKRRKGVSGVERVRKRKKE